MPGKRVKASTRIQIKYQNRLVRDNGKKCRNNMRNKSLNSSND